MQNIRSVSLNESLIAVRVDRIICCQGLICQVNLGHTSSWEVNQILLDKNYVLPKLEQIKMSVVSSKLSEGSDFLLGKKNKFQGSWIRRSKIENQEQRFKFAISNSRSKTSSGLRFNIAENHEQNYFLKKMFHSIEIPYGRFSKWNVLMSALGWPFHIWPFENEFHGPSFNSHICKEKPHTNLGYEVILKNGSEFPSKKHVTCM